MLISDDVGSRAFVEYHRLRAAHERESAERARDPSARRIHAELASRHQALADGDDAEQHSAMRMGG